MMNKLLLRRVLCCLLLLALPVVTLSGCNNSRIVDHINMVTVLGFDRDKSELVGTALYQDYDHEGKIEILEGKGQAVNLMLDAINMKSSQPIDLGKLCLLVFSKEFAEAGIEHIIKTFCRDPLLSSNLVIAIADGSSADMFKDLKGKGSEWLPYFLLEQNVKSGNAPFSNMGIFLYDFYGQGRDAFVPYFSKDGKGNIEIKGMGIFRQDKLKLILNPRESLLLKMLGGSYEGGNMAINLRNSSSEGVSTLSLIKGKVRPAVTRAKGTTTITYHEYIDATVRDYPAWLQIRSEDHYNLLRTQLEEQIEQESLQLLHKFQRNGVDPLGSGDLIRAHTRKPFEEEKFYAGEYGSLKFRVVPHILLHESWIGE